MGNAFDVCTAKRAEHGAGDGGDGLPESGGSRVLEQRTLSSGALRGVLNTKGHRNHTAGAGGSGWASKEPRGGGGSGRGASSTWRTRDKQMQHISGHLNQTQDLRNAQVTDITLKLQRAGGHAYTSAQRPPRATPAVSSAAALGAYRADVKQQFQIAALIEDSLCNPHIPAPDVMRRFETLSVAERLLLYSNHKQQEGRRNAMIAGTANTAAAAGRRPHSAADSSFIRNAICSMPIFYSFTGQELENLISKFTKLRCLSGKRIIVEGDVNDRRFFVIKSGRFEIRRGTSIIAQVSSGVGIGELALVVSGRARGASVVALENAELFVLSPDAFWNVTATSLMSLQNRAVTVVKSVASFREAFGKDPSLVEGVAGKLFFKRYKPGEIVMRKGTDGSAFFILVEGKVQVCGDPSHVTKAMPTGADAQDTKTGKNAVDAHDAAIEMSNPGDSFGERSLMTKEQVSRDIVAAGNKGDSVLLAGLSRASFETLPRVVLQILDRQLAETMIEYHPCLAHLSAADRSAAKADIRFTHFEHEAKLITEGSTIKFLYIIRRGVCEILKLSALNVEADWEALTARQQARRRARLMPIKMDEVTVNECVGEVSLAKGTTAGASVVARGPVDVFAIPKHVYLKYLKGCPYLKQLATSRTTANIQTIQMSSLANLKTAHFKWKELLVVNRAYSSVKLVRHSSTKGCFCCRVVNKAFAEAR